jgi:hypothetical protein
MRQQCAAFSAAGWLRGEFRSVASAVIKLPLIDSRAAKSTINFNSERRRARFN